MKKIFYIFILIVLNFTCLTAQNLPIIKATSKNVKIRDGANLKNNFWVIIPETKPDIYYVDIPKRDQKITFITDKDSISFDVKYGSNYDFIILLNDKDSCYTRISANYPKLLDRVASHPKDTIPFTIIDNRIYVKGTINNSQELMFQFDLGAGGVGVCNINHKSVKKVTMEFDKTTTLINSDGNNQTRLSTKNKLKIGKSEWNNIEFVETKNMNKYEDAIFGNGLFIDKYIEVDYDKKLLIISEQKPVISTEYKKYPMLLEGGVKPLVQASFELEGKKYTDWFQFDIGNTSNGIVSYNYLSNNNIYDKFSKVITIGDRAVARIPILHFADTIFTDGTISLDRKYNPASGFTDGGGLLGSKILKKFNFVLDNQQGYIYLKPNIYFDEKDNGLRNIYVVVTLITLSVALLLFSILKTLRKRKSKRKKRHITKSLAKVGPDS